MPDAVAVMFDPATIRSRAAFLCERMKRGESEHWVFVPEAWDALVAFVDDHIRESACRPFQRGSRVL